MDYERLLQFEGGVLIIGRGYLKHDGITVYITAKEHLILSLIVDAQPEGLSFTNINMEFNQYDTEKARTIIHSFAHTIRKKLMMVTSNKVGITWDRKEKAYYLQK